MSGQLTPYENYFFSFFGDQPNYYLEEFRWQNAGRKWSFNIGAFFFGLLWFVYRKMYYHAAILFALIMILGQVETYVYDYFKIGYEIQRVTSVVISIGWGFIAGYTGNYFYCKIAKQKVDDILKNTDEESQRIALLQKSGGTTYLVYVVVVLLAAFFFITSK